MREGRGISTDISDVFLLKLKFKNKRIIKKLCLDNYTKKIYPNIGTLCQLGQWYKVENLQFYLGGVIWDTWLSGAFDYNQVFLGIFTIDMNKLY